MAYKVFSNGDALTGSEVNTYLMNQSVMVFASTTARDAALTAPTEGMVVWLQDSDKYVYYTGSAWANLITPAPSGNAIINGAFDIWQRGTSFSMTTANTFTADRFRSFRDGTGATVTVSQQAFTPGTAPVSGYESAYFWRYAQTVAGTGGTYSNFLVQNIEDVRTFAGQTVTLSFWAKADAARSIRVNMGQTFGSGGSADVYLTDQTIALTTSWARYTATFTMGSLTGKTIGTGSSIFPQFATVAVNTIQTIDIWGVQLEAGSTATAFKRNASNIQGELAACQRYYFRNTATSLFSTFGQGRAQSTTASRQLVNLPVTMRVQPTSVDYASLRLSDGGAGNYTATSLTIQTDTSHNQTMSLAVGVSSGLTSGQNFYLYADNSTSAYVGFSAEL